MAISVTFLFINAFQATTHNICPLRPIHRPLPLNPLQPQALPGPILPLQPRRPRTTITHSLPHPHPPLNITIVLKICSVYFGYLMIVANIPGIAGCIAFLVGEVASCLGGGFVVQVREV